MELVDFIKVGLERVKTGTMTVIDGLTPQELAWRPNAEANSIGIILFHQARSEDVFVQGRIQGKPQVWETDKWYEKLNKQINETGSGYTAEQCAAFQVPDLKTLLAYYDAVRAQTLEYLNSLKPGDFDKVISLPRLGDLSVGAIFALTIVHSARHVGEISYLRGLQRGMNK